MKSLLLAAILSGAAAISPASAYAPYGSTFSERLQNLQEFSFTLLQEAPLTSAEMPLALLDREVRLRVDTLHGTCVYLTSQAGRLGNDSETFCLGYIMQVV